MAESPSHRFGQVIGNLLEELVKPILEDAAESRQLMVDSKGPRSARKGKKVSWTDRFGNVHDLDFVIERNGTWEELGQPVAFVECAWRRYTKHSRNKAQEVQAAILPLADRFSECAPFKAVVLAGEFTPGSLNQLKSSGFTVLHFAYSDVVSAFAVVGIDAAFTESTPDAEFEKKLAAVGRLKSTEYARIIETMVRARQVDVATFKRQLCEALDRVVDRIVVLPLQGRQHEFSDLASAMAFLRRPMVAPSDVTVAKIEIIVRYSNGDRVEAVFSSTDAAEAFLLRLKG